MFLGALLLLDVASIESEVKATLVVPPLTELKTLGGFFWRRLEIVMSEPPVICAEIVSLYDWIWGVVW